MSSYEESKLDYMIDICTTRVSVETHRLEALNKGTMMYTAQLSVVQHEKNVLELLKELKDAKEKIKELEETIEYIESSHWGDDGFIM